MRIFLVIAFCMTFLCLGAGSLAAEQTSPSQNASPGSEDQEIPLPELPPLEAESGGAIEATIINPYRSANVGTDISGIVEACFFEEGDFVPEGRVVVEISKKRYLLQAEKAEEAVKGFEASLFQAEKQVKLFRQLLTQDATTQQELLKAETEREVADTRLKQARKDYELAELTLHDSQVRSPFAGYLAFRYKQPFEPVERLEKIFTIVDTASVYAVANVAEQRLHEFKKSTQASFIEASGKTYTGIVDRVGKVIDVKSKTKRVYVLIDNSRGELEIGMTGSLQPAKSGVE
jgi:RND family efflux transporter MFP subunit